MNIPEIVYHSDVDPTKQQWSHFAAILATIEDIIQTERPTRIDIEKHMRIPKYAQSPDAKILVPDIIIDNKRIVEVEQTQISTKPGYKNACDKLNMNYEVVIYLRVPENMLSHVRIKLGTYEELEDNTRWNYLFDNTTKQEAEPVI